MENAEQGTVMTGKKEKSGPYLAHKKHPRQLVAV